MTAISQIAQRNGLVEQAGRSAVETYPFWRRRPAVLLRRLRYLAVSGKAGGRALVGWIGEVRCLGEVDTCEESMRRLVKRIATKHERVHFCYEAGPTGYGLYRLITMLGFPCTVVAPSLIPRKLGDRVKTNRRDAVALAKLLRADELTPVWVPDESHEAMWDLVRARAAAVETLRYFAPVALSQK